MHSRPPETPANCLTRSGISTSFTYADFSEPLTETYAGGTMAGLSVNRAYDQSLRLHTVEAKSGATVMQGATCGYATARCLLEGYNPHSGGIGE